MKIKRDVKSGAAASAASRLRRREVLRYVASTAIAGIAMSVYGSPNERNGRRSVVVETAGGKLRGVVERSSASFKGIRYGDSTAGPNRFRPPQPVIPWTGIRDATHLGHPCPQTNPDLRVWLDPVAGSEDCLVLNVWAPEAAHRGSKLPVMFWIHGGGYTFGSAGAPLYDLGNLAQSGGVVAVGVNHRLQAFGFSDLSQHGNNEFAQSGNAGMLDLIAALQWVQTNIEHFGGDPTNVTVFGQSGGGAKISFLMGMPASAGLFHKAIVESGSVFRCRLPDEAAATSDRMFELLAIAKNDIRTLQRVPASVLLQCGDRIMAEARGTGHPSLKYAPVVDGHDVPSRPWDLVAPAGARNIPLLLGTNRDETIIYLSADANRGPDDEVAIAKAVIESVPGYTPDRSRVADLVPIYRKAMGHPSKMELVLQMSTDLSYWIGMVHQAELQAASGANVYSYRCDWRTPCFGGQWAPHGVELPFVMGHRHYGPAWDGKDTDSAREAADPDHARFRVGDQMLTAWTNFARTGNPSSTSLEWPNYDLESRSTMIFDRATKVVSDPRGEFRRPLKAVFQGKTSTEQR